MRAPIADELVDEEHARLEHLLEHQDHALALRGRDDGDRHHVGREGRPRLVLELRDVPAEVGADDALLPGGDDEIVPFRILAVDTEPLEPERTERRCSTPARDDVSAERVTAASPMNEPTSM
jgi:hypothetical protein